MILQLQIVQVARRQLVHGPLGGTHVLQTFSVREGTLTGGGQHAINAAGHT
ncbi:hypothetical protein ABGV42_24525 [Paenibacillus pabuli]